MCLTLALAIGVNTAVFSTVNALLLTRLPYAQPERLGTMFARTTGSDASSEKRSVDGEQWQILRDDVPSVSAAVSALHTSG